MVKALRNLSNNKMQLFKSSCFAFFFLTILVFSSCKKDKSEDPVTVESDFPPDVDAIITKKCATSGCHNTQGKSTAGGLDLSDMEHMLQGTGAGAVVIPFRPDQSTMLFFTNTDSTLGPVLKPTMPFDLPPLSTQEYLTLKNWIENGAPDENGTIPFSGNPLRRKLYVVNQGCDLLSVFDAQKRVIMRYYDLGVQTGISESPHNIKVTPDGKYFLVVFLFGDFVQMFRTGDDSFVANIPIGDGVSGNWNTITISSDSRKAYAVDYAGNRIAFIDLLSKTSTTKGPFPLFYGNGLHGIALNATDDTLYVAEDLGNGLLTIPVNDIPGYDERNLRALYPDTGALGIHEVAFTPDHTKYFITCGNANQVWVFDAATNAVLDTFHVGIKPLEIAFSKSSSTPYAFITCQEANTFPGTVGAVEVINYQTMQHIKTLKAGWQPHGIAVDDVSGLLYVVNRNVNTNGPAPHHTTGCGRNGSLSTFDINTWQKLSGSPELSSDPYQIAIRP